MMSALFSPSTSHVTKHHITVVMRALNLWNHYGDIIKQTRQFLPAHSSNILKIPRNVNHSWRVEGPLNGRLHSCIHPRRMASGGDEGASEAGVCHIRCSFLCWCASCWWLCPPSLRLVSWNNVHSHPYHYIMYLYRLCFYWLKWTYLIKPDSFLTLTHCTLSLHVVVISSQPRAVWRVRYHQLSMGVCYRRLDHNTVELPRVCAGASDWQQNYEPSPTTLQAQKKV